MWPARNPSDLRAERPRIVITGPPVHALSGIATHVNLLLGSSVCRRFTLAHLYAGGEGLVEGFARRILRRLRTPVRLLMMVVTWRPAILHINTALNARSLPRDAALLLVAWLTRCPVVWQVHGGSSIVELERNQPHGAADAEAAAEISAASRRHQWAGRVGVRASWSRQTGCVA